MGASKEGRMSVRERISWVLQENKSLLQEIEAPTEGEGEENVFVPTGSSALGVSNGSSEISNTEDAGGGVGKQDSCHRKSPLSSSSSSSSEGVMRGEGRDSALDLTILLDDQLRLINLLNERLKKAESNAEVVGKERDKLQAALDSERLERNTLLRKNEMLEEQRTKSEATIKEKEEKIQELEGRLTVVTTPKPVIHQGTRMTPLPLTVEENDEENGDMSPRKRRKLDTREGDTATGSNDSSELCTSTPPQTYHHNKLITRDRRSASPPQLSPPVALKSTAQNSRSRGSENRELSKFLAGDQVDDSVSDYPLDEFQDELDKISYLSQHNRGGGTRSQIGPPDRLMQSGSSAFSRPLPRPRQLANVTLPENTRPFVSQSPLKSMQQFRQSLQHSTTTSNSLAPKNSTPSSDTSLSREPPQLINIRNNNFLNMSRPIARRPPTAPFTPTSLQSSQVGPLSEDTSQQSLSRSLNDSSTSEVVKANDELTVNPETPAVVKKRRPGRPLGFRPKKREPAKAINSWSPNSVGLSDTRLSNGLRDDLLSKSEPPAAPRFSKRGRLLKPNRARYSPDPDNSTHSSSREKFMTTKKNYYVSEPFVPEGYGGSLDGTMNSDTLLGADVDSLSRKGIEDEEPILRTAEREIGEGDGAGPAANVEVPQWRIVTEEDEEERNPPDDDMSEEAFVKRHQKPEVQEKQRKRWDLQMLREESYKDKMQRRQIERERQKELRRQQRKRKGRAGATEEEIVNPSVEDIKAIYIGQELPVGAFGQTLPINEKVDFQFSIGCASPPTALPSPNPVSTTTTTTTTIDNANTDVTSSCNVRESESCSSSEVTLVVNVNREEVNVSDRLVSEETELPAVTLEGRLSGPSSTSPTPQPPLPSPTSSSSLSLPSPVPQSSTPPPPVIFCVRDNDDKAKDVYEYTEDDDNLPAPSLVTSLSVSDRACKITTPSKEKEQEPELPSTSIDSSSTNIVRDEDSSIVSPITSSPAKTLSSVAISNSPRIHSTVTIPLSVPSIKGRISSGGCGGQGTLANQLENLAMTRSPVSSATHSPSDLSTTPKSASIKFFIPKNPLARPRIPASVSAASCSTASAGSNSSVKLIEDEHSCKDKDLQS